MPATMMALHDSDPKRCSHITICIEHGSGAIAFYPSPASDGRVLEEALKTITDKFKDDIKAVRRAVKGGRP